MPSHGVLNASLAGLFAAFAGLSAKFALSSDSPQILTRFGNQYFPETYVIKALFLTKIVLLEPKNFSFRVFGS